MDLILIFGQLFVKDRCTFTLSQIPILIRNYIFYFYRLKETDQTDTVILSQNRVKN